MFLGSVACGKRHLPSGYALPSRHFDGAVPASIQVFLVADNQQQYLYGDPVWIRTSLVDKFVASAVRAPQLDMFGPSVLEWVVETYGEQAPFIHLGDGLNLSCSHEFENFLCTMSKAKNGWYMAPGNHDGIYFGSSGSETEWAAACRGVTPDVIHCDENEGRLGRVSGEPDRPFTKAMFVDSYIQRALVPNANLDAIDPGVAAFANSRRANVTRGASSKPAVERWDYAGSEPAFFTRAAWRIDRQRPYRSFIVQELTATRRDRRNPYTVKFILLDTSDYRHSPELVPIPPHVNPGSTGDLSQEQVAVVEAWLKDAESIPSGANPPIVVFMGHHPFGALKAEARQEFERLRREHQVLLYVSAHTHRGDYFIRGDDASSWLELNLGSLVDWPLEFREFSVLSHVSDDGAPRLYTNATLYELRDELDGFACDSAWQPQAGDQDYYVDYVEAVGLPATKTARLVFDSLLHSYVRLLEHFPSAPDNDAWPAVGNPAPQSDVELLAFIERTAGLDAGSAGLLQKRRLLYALEAFDRDRTLATASQDDLQSVQSRHRNFRLCQAFWASMDDETGARRARREDWFVAYPPRKAK
jgi:hypothetical protein